MYSSLSYSITSARATESSRTLLADFDLLMSCFRAALSLAHFRSAFVTVLTLLSLAHFNPLLCTFRRLLRDWLNFDHSSLHDPTYLQCQISVRWQCFTTKIVNLHLKRSISIGYRLAALISIEKRQFQFNSINKLTINFKLINLIN